MFSMFYTYPLIGKYLSGTTASGLYEARLGKEYMGGETHVYSAAYRDDEIDEILEICDHIVFNSQSQWSRYKERQLRQARSTALELILNIQHRRVMRYMIHVLNIREWE